MSAKKVWLTGMIPLTLLLMAGAAHAQLKSADEILRALDEADHGPRLPDTKSTKATAKKSTKATRTAARLQGEMEPETLPAVEVEDEGTQMPDNHSDITHSYGGHGCCDECCRDECCCNPCDDCCHLWGGDAFFVVDGWKSRIDDDHHNNFGTRTGINLAMPIQCSTWSGQLGASHGVYDFHGRERFETTSAEQQFFLTGGAFRAADPCGCCWYDAFNVGCVYDHMVTDNSGDTSAELSLGQVRCYLGYVWDDCNEYGVWATWGGDQSDDLIVDAAGVPIQTRAMEQANFFWRRHWCSGADTMIYIGFAEDPGEATFGFRGELPLSENLWVVAGAHYILPSTSGGNSPVNSYAEETWNVFVGLSWRLGQPRSCSVVPNPWTPLLPVADNGSFALEAPAGNF